MRASPRPNSSTPWPLNPSTGRASSPQTLYKPKFATEPSDGREATVQRMHCIVLPHGMKELCLSFEEKNALALGQGPPPRGRSLAYPRCLRVLREGICFQGDEASPMTPDHKPEVSGKAGDPVEVQAASQAPSLSHWYALYTRSHCEQLVADQLAAKGFQV